MARANNTDYEQFERGILIRLSGVDSGYGATTVLRSIDFEARAGEVALVTGPAAAGKTTLMHLLRLALAPRAGRAVILGVDVGRATASVRAHVKRRIGYVAENPTFVEGWTAFDNIAMPLRMLGRKPRDYEQDVRELVDFVGLGNAANLTVEKLSGAERHRAAIARALEAATIARVGVNLRGGTTDEVRDELSEAGVADDRIRAIVELVRECRQIHVRSAVEHRELDVRLVQCRVEFARGFARITGQGRSLTYRKAGQHAMFPESGRDTDARAAAQPGLAHISAARPARLTDAPAASATRLPECEPRHTWWGG